MRIFLLEGNDTGESEITLSGNDFHYICRVLRKKNGQSFLCRYANGPVYEAVISKMEEQTCTVSLRETNMQPAEKNSRIILIQGIPKGKKMDMIVRQATEVGVSAILPVFTRFTVVKMEKEQDRKHKQERWKKIVKEASQQSGNGNPPEIFEPLPIEDINRHLPNDFLGFVFHQDAHNAPDIFTSLQRNPDLPVVICIGPEGGFSETEVEELSRRGFQPACFGPLVLRTETAGLYAVSAIQNLQGVFSDGSEYPRSSENKFS